MPDNIPSDALSSPAVTVAPSIESEYQKAAIYSCCTDGEICELNTGYERSTNTYLVGQDGNLSISYDQGLNVVKVPLKIPRQTLYPSADYASPAFYISTAKTAIAYGAGSTANVMVSDDAGQTWNKYLISDSLPGYTGYYVQFVDVENGWFIATTPPAAGMCLTKVFVTSDGGKTWAETGDTTDLYPSSISGIGFSTKDIGFIGFTFKSSTSPDVYWTQNGGQTWAKLDIMLPPQFDHDTPGSPVFNGANGIMPIYLSNGIVYITTNNYGKTWTYPEYAG